MLGYFRPGDCHGRFVLSGSLSLDERTLILAPEQVAATAAKLLSGSGIACLCTGDKDRFGLWLAEGVAVVIVDLQTLTDDPQSPLHRFIDEQPEWSDLPVLLLNTHATTDNGSMPQRLGNLSRLSYPFDEQQLLDAANQALRARRRQYMARNALSALRERLDSQQADGQARHQTRKMEAIGQLAGGVAHDFNNLLTSIGGSFELIDRRLQQGRTEGLDKFLRMGQDAVARAAMLTHRLLAFSSRQSLQSQAVDLHALLQPARLQATLGNSVKLSLRMADALWPVQADDKQLRESLDNLLVNAREAMPSGGHLSIEARNQHIDAEQFEGAGLSSGDYLQLTFSDTGQGMSHATLEHAFEPFFSTKPVGQGIGLGLSMVYGFSKQSHGHVTMESQIGQGTRVDLYLPRCLSTPPQALEVASTPIAGSCREVLIVEDDREVRELLCQALRDDGFPCQSACDATQALNLLRSSQPIALLISDVGLPGMNGRQLAEIARALRPSLPVLFITGYAETAMSREGFLDPGMQLICKPFELHQLSQRVAQMLGEA